MIALRSTFARDFPLSDGGRRLALRVGVSRLPLLAAEVRPSRRLTGTLKRGPHGVKLATRLHANVLALQRTVAYEERVLARSREAELTPSAGDGWGGEARRGAVGPA